MDTKEKLVAAVCGTLLRTFPENDPRARARRYFPAFAKVGYLLTGSVVFYGALFVSSLQFQLVGLLCVLYGVATLPALGMGGFIVSSFLYQITVMILKIRDRQLGIPQSQPEDDQTMV